LFVVKFYESQDYGLAMSRRTTTTFSLPVGMRSALYAEASRRATTPSRVLEALPVRHLPEFVASGIRQTLDTSGATPATDLTERGGET
jgi:hypothetical protein